jgi:(S)-2-hydroxyglutarate dehydrogenase
MSKKVADFVIAGSGIIGLNLARALSVAYPDSSIKILEKEKQLGLHTSGRNSGVLHAGFYYQTDSVKARFCRQGCQEWTDYCEENNIRIKRCGKLVTAKAESEMEYLY